MLKRAPWGKTDNGEHHHLAHHCADVAACFEAIIASPVVLSRLEKCADECLSKSQLARLSVIVFLHDCGKLHPGFQAKGWPKGLWPARFRGHLAEGMAIFCEDALKLIAQNLHFQSLVKWDTTFDLLSAVFSHHGRPIKESIQAGKQWSSVPACGYDPVAASADLGKLIESWFPDAFLEDSKKLPSKINFQHLFCGLVSLADWLGSSQNIFSYIPDPDPNYMETARKLARMAVARTGLNVRRWQESVKGRTDFKTLTCNHTPLPQQSLVGEFPLHEQLLILEAETGSGKTEAALWRFIRLFEAQRVDSLYFALPTRAAAIQIHRRVNRAMENVFGAEAPEAVLAVSGYLKSGEVEGKKLPKWQVRWDDDGGEDEKTLLTRWAAENTKRALAAPVTVGTVDQAMLAALQVKHAHLRASALSRSLLVIDEVHASDRYMTSVQNHLLQMHLSRGGYGMLMSATLGSVARAKWLGKPLQSYEESVSSPYPAVWGRGRSVRQSSDHINQSKTVSMTLIPTMSAKKIATLGVDAATSGARVLIVRNTVDAALEAFHAVHNMGAGNLLLQVEGGPALHHSRFAPEDRKLLDARVERELSPNRKGTSGMIVIGTQTLEQSLDIDSDMLVTDLCPVDVLLQRIGRLHRRKRSRPVGFEQPKCYVLSPEEGLEELLSPCFINGLGAWKTPHGLEGIYRDVSGLELTRQLIDVHRSWEIPKMNRFLVESATHPEKVEYLHNSLGQAWVDYSVTVFGEDIAAAGAAKSVALPIDIKFSDLQFPDNEEKIRTRLGCEGACITFDKPLVGPFGKEVSCLTLPSHWSLGVDSDVEVTTEVKEDYVLVRLEDRAFTYSREGLKKF